MTQQEIYGHLQKVFRDTFDNEAIVLSPQTTAADIEGWDSFAQVHLLLAIESAFHVKFKSSDLDHIEGVGDMVAFIEKNAK